MLAVICRIQLEAENQSEYQPEPCLGKVFLTFLNGDSLKTLDCYQKWFLNIQCVTVTLVQSMGAGAADTCIYCD